MNHWIFIVTNQKTESGSVPVREIYEHRVAGLLGGASVETDDC